MAEKEVDFAKLRAYIDACLRTGRALQPSESFFSSNPLVISELLQVLKSILPPRPDPETDAALREKLSEIDKSLLITKQELHLAQHRLSIVRKQSKVRTAYERTQSLTRAITKLEAEKYRLMNPKDDDKTAVRRHAVKRLEKEFELWKRGDLEFSFANSVRRVYWQILATSGDSWKEICEYFNRVSRTTGHRYELSRLQRIYSSFLPSEVYVGLTCFEGYVVFCFPKSGLSVLECPKVGNALYLMPHAEWKFLSQASKTELLSKHSDRVSRILHTESWFDQLTRQLSCKDSRW